MRSVGTGFASVDEALGGLVTGDNVVWLCDTPAVYDALCRGFTRSAIEGGHRVVHVSFGAGTRDRFDDVEHLDASARSALGRPAALADELDRRFQTDRPDCVVVDDLGVALRRWGAAATSDFFTRTCPSMLQAGVTAYWCVGSGFGRSALRSVRQITQCLVDVRDDRLRVLKSEGRAAGRPGVAYRLRVGDGAVHVALTPAGGRLARGLVALRRDLGLTQQELARIAGVTASAISQAESGARGLSVDTLLRISDDLDIPVDRLVSAAPPPAYHLARHDRSRRSNDVVALVPDTTIGARVELVELATGATGSPDRAHHGVEVIAAVRGLVQIDLGDDRPVLRGGDALVVEHGIVRSWRNLRREPAAFFRVLRD